jgi:hypothetical protein
MYLTEMLGLPIIEDDSSSESSDSDCFIIPRSSFTGKELVLFNSDMSGPPIVEMLTTSKYHSLDSIQILRGAVQFSGSGKESDVIIEPVGVDELVTAVNTSPPHYFFMYGVVVQSFNLWFPLTSFEISLFRILNIAPIQLHPNSWGFIKAFEIVCLALGVSPSPGVFFSFYYIKSFSADRLVSLCSQSNRSLFSLYANNFKNYQDSFYRVRGGPSCPDVMYDGDTPLFPFYWSNNPRFLKGANCACLSSFEMETVGFLNSFKILSTKEVVNLESDIKDVLGYLSKYRFCFDVYIALQYLFWRLLTFMFFVVGKMKTISDAEFASYLLRAKEKRDNPDAVVPPLSQVVVCWVCRG